MRISDWSSDVCSSDLILEPLFKFGGPDADFLDRLHPENVRIPMTWRNVEPDRRINDRITWEGWCRLAHEESATMIKPGIDDIRYSELVQRTEIGRESFGYECVSTYRSRCAPSHEKKITITKCTG